MVRGLLATSAIVLAAGCAAHRATQEPRRQAQSAAQSQVGTVARVVDGDTIHVSLAGQDKTVRLIGIDTPETHKPRVKVECGGREASANMVRLAPVGARATLASDPTQDRVDRYGRLLAYVSVNHRSLQLEQLRAGWAMVYVYHGHPFQRVASFSRASAVAEHAHRGVWGACAGDFHSEQPTAALGPPTVRLLRVSYGKG